jgi:hypothetical protein
MFLTDRASIIWYVQVLCCMEVWLQGVLAMYLSCLPTLIVTLTFGVITLE